MMSSKVLSLGRLELSFRQAAWVARRPVVWEPYAHRPDCLAGAPLTLRYAWFLGIVWLAIRWKIKQGRQ